MYGQQKQLVRNVNNGSLPSGQGRTQLLNRLIQMWISNGVDDQYQSIVSGYIDGLQDWGVQQREIEKEIHMTVARQSHYFVLMGLVEERRTALVQLKGEVIGLNRYIQNDCKEEPDLQLVAVLLGRIRKMQIVMCESIVQMDEKYDLLRISGDKYQKRGVTYLEMLSRFDSDLRYLKDSLLRYYIPFTLQFDPFFVEHGRELKTLCRQNVMIYDNNIERLFSLSPSFMHRLIKGRKKLLNLISRNINSGQIKEIDYQEKTYNIKVKPSKIYDKVLQQKVYEPIFNNNSLQSDITIKKKRSISELINSKLNNSAYLQDKEPSDNEFRVQKLNPIVSYPSRKQSKNDSMIYERQFKIKNSLRRQRESELDQSLNEIRIRSRTKSIRQITPKTREKITVTSKKKQSYENNLKIDTSVLKIDVNNEAQQLSSKKHRKRSIKQIKNQIQYQQVKDYRSYDKVKEATDKINKLKSKVLNEIKTPTVKKLQQNSFFRKQQEQIEQYQKQDHHISKLRRYFQRNKQPSQRHRKSQSPKVRQPKTINPFPELPYKSNELLTPKRNSNKDTGMVQVKVRRVQHQSEIMLPKSKQKRIIDSLEHRQKQIIRNINQKYKAIAQKQKQYELSKLGHNIAHKMKQKQRIKHNQNKTISNKVFVQKQ